jgi:flagellar protein FliJ
MTKFQFRMQSVLTLRQRERDQAAMAVQQAEAARQKLLEQIADLEGERQRQNSDRTTASLGTIDVNRLLDVQRYQGSLIERVLGLKSHLNLIEEELAKRRARLTEHEQGVKALEKLAEQQRSVWLEAEQGRQQQLLDEWASYQHYQRKEA